MASRNTFLSNLSHGFWGLKQFLTPSFVSKPETVEQNKGTEVNISLSEQNNNETNEQNKQDLPLACENAESNKIQSRNVENEHFVHRHSTPIVHNHTNFTHEMNGSYIPSQINSKSLNTDILNKAGEAQYTVCNVDTHVGNEQNTCNTHIYDTNSSGCAAGSSNVCNKTCSLYTPSTSSNVSDYREHVYSNTGHTNPNLFGKTSNGSLSKYAVFGVS